MWSIFTFVFKGIHPPPSWKNHDQLICYFWNAKPDAITNRLMPIESITASSLALGFIIEMRDDFKEWKFVFSAHTLGRTLSSQLRSINRIFNSWTINPCDLDFWGELPDHWQTFIKPFVVSGRSAAAATKYGFFNHTILIKLDGCRNPHTLNITLQTNGK